MQRLMNRQISSIVYKSGKLAFLLFVCLDDYLHLILQIHMSENNEVHRFSVPWLWASTHPNAIHVLIKLSAFSSFSYVPLILFFCACRVI